MEGIDLTNFEENYIYLDCEGYLLNPCHVIYSNSDPLFSWQKKRVQTTLHWGQKLGTEKTSSFWVTELCIVQGQSFHDHIIPGAIFELQKNSSSFKSFNYVWRHINERYIFNENEIFNQSEVQTYLQNLIKRDTVVFHKGGSLERSIAELCGATAVNIEELGIEKPPVSEFSYMYNTHQCKIHKHNFEHCPLTEVEYYLNKLNTWLPVYENKKNIEEGWEEQNEGQEEVEEDEELTDSELFDRYRRPFCKLI